MNNENTENPPENNSETPQNQPNEEQPPQPAPVTPPKVPPQPATPAPESAPKPTPTPPPPTGPAATVEKPIQRVTEDESMDRRSFVKWLTVGWAAFAAVVAGYGALTARFMFPNVLFEPKQSFRAGFPDEYPIGEVSEKFKAAQAVWIVRDSEKIFALSTVCTHLGCTPNWLDNEGKFKCPCHGSGFYSTGINFEGPAPRPLERFKITVSDDGEIIVDKTKKFQQEKGEWSDPESFIVV